MVDSSDDREIMNMYISNRYNDLVLILAFNMIMAVLGSADVLKIISSSLWKYVFLVSVHFSIRKVEGKATRE